MSVTGGRFSLSDNRFSAGLGVLVGLCTLANLLRVDSVSTEGAISLSRSYAQFANYALAAFVYVPTFTFCATGALGPLDAAIWVTRTNRITALSHALARLTARTVVFSALLTTCCLMSVRLSSSVAFAAGDYLKYGLLSTTLQTFYFLVVGLVVLVVRLITRSGAYAALAAFGYGALDYLLCMTSALNNTALWTGWLLVVATPEDGLVAEGIGALRLASACVILGLLAAYLVRRRDYLPEEGESREF
jgi:hypothetical protein